MNIEPVKYWIHSVIMAMMMFASGVAHAHQSSDSFLIINASSLESVFIDWSILLSDLEVAVGLDVNEDLRVTESEFNERAPAIIAYAFEHLSLLAGQSPCPLSLTAIKPKAQSDQAMAQLLATARCPAANTLSVNYRLLFDLDTTHRGLLSIETPGGIQTSVLAPQNSLQQFDLGGGSRIGVLHFIGEGIHHILIGYDHIAFLLLLLLPAAMVRGSSGWEYSSKPAAITVEVLRVITAFTVAHSLTLGLAVTGVLRVPVTLAELMIAVSVVAAAAANFLAASPRQRWMLAFGFGLIHGFGFASVFSELGIQGAGLVGVLLSFNVGVEIGQLAIVALVLPVIIGLSRCAVYRRPGFQLVSGAIAAVGVIWFLQRLPAL